MASHLQDVWNATYFLTLPALKGDLTVRSINAVINDMQEEYELVMAAAGISQNDRLIFKELVLDNITKEYAFLPR